MSDETHDVGAATDELEPNDVTCSECGVTMPADSAGVSTQHAPSCSLHAGNITG